VHWWPGFIPPWFYLFKPALILKNNLGQLQNISLRKIFIVFQFVASMALDFGQCDYHPASEFSAAQGTWIQTGEVIVLPIKDRSMNTRIEQLRTELLKVPGVSGVSAASNIPGKSFNQNPIYAVRNHKRLGMHPKLWWT